jgi:malonate-semialdehyde dehydrogenase (acetylating) / methylmalonate-semialdehyde dehydrogenase
VRTIPHWIAGHGVEGASGRSGDVFDPAAGEVTAQVPFASEDEVDAAVAAATTAYDSWREASLAQRTQVLFAFRELVDRHRDDLARIVTSEHGKTVDEARGEVQRGLDVVDFACGVPQLLKGDYSRRVSREVDVVTIREPLGVVVGITPFNFPVMVPMWMHPVAIACGNTFVLKPSEKDPSASVRVAELWAQAGLPDGVFNVVHGDRVAVERLCTHPDVEAVSFVGSTPVAESVHRVATQHGKRVQALGGAKNHLVALPDCDVDLTVDAATSAAFGSAGERCMAVSVVVAVGDVGDPLVEGIAARARKLAIGPGSDIGVEMGPLVTGDHLDRVASYLDRGVEEGADLVVDGRELVSDDGGFFLGPCLFDRVTPDMAIYRDEIFGPVLCVVRADSFDEAVAIVNEANPYGNGVAVFTSSGAAADRFSDAARIGMVGVNVAIPVPPAYHSFGGWERSLFGPAHVHGEDGVRFYTRAKVIATRWPEPGGRDVGFAPR